MTMAGIRRRLPLVLAVLAALSLLTMGFACVCAPNHHSSQAIERTVSSIPVVAVPVVGAWIAILLMLPAAAALLERRRFGFGRASPALLQRFLI